MLIAFVLAFPLAWERERTGRNLGPGTLPIVAVASCGYYMLVALQTQGTTADSVTPLAAGLLGGMGFHRRWLSTPRDGRGPAEFRTPPLA